MPLPSAWPELIDACFCVPVTLRSCWRCVRVFDGLPEHQLAVSTQFVNAAGCQTPKQPDALVLYAFSDVCN